VAPAPAGQVDGRHARRAGRDLAGQREGLVGAGVVDHGDEGPEGERLVEEAAELSDPRPHVRGLVVDRDDDLDVEGHLAWIRARLGKGQDCHGRDPDPPSSQAFGYTLCVPCELTSTGRPGPLLHQTISTVSAISIVSGATGRRTVTIIPSPGADFAVTVPPWAATMAATMERPSPLPPWLRARDASTR